MQSTRLKKGPSDVVWPEDRFCIPVPEMPAIIREDDGGLSERVSGFVSEFADILLRVV